MQSKFTLKQFREQYPDEDACLEKVFELSRGGLTSCPKCGCRQKYHRIKTRRAYQCPRCYHQVYPTKGTIFEKTRTPLTYWFYAIFLFTASKNGLAATELQRQLGVTNKTAMRMLRLIRSCADDSTGMFSEVVQCDETFVGGKNKNRHKDKKVKNSQGRSFKDKTPVMGILHPGGKVKAFVVPDTKAPTLQYLIRTNVKGGSLVMTDEWYAYRGIGDHYTHEFVDHGRKEYVNGTCTTNGIENFWSILKRTISGCYIGVSRKYLHLYVKECVFRFNNRNNPGIFSLLVSLACSSSRASSGAYQSPSGRSDWAAYPS